MTGNSPSSGALVRPSDTSPARRKRLTTSGVKTPRKSLKNTEPKVTGSPTSEVRSLMRNGTPAKGPLTVAVAARSASARAASNLVETTALIAGLTVW